MKNSIKRRGIIYIAGPYSNDAPSDRLKNASAEKRLARFTAVTEVARVLIEQNEIVYSPLTMTHPIDVRMKNDPGSAFWVSFDEAFMFHCDRMLILRLPGWDESSGVEREIKFFQCQGVEPEYLDPDQFGITEKESEFAAAFS